MLSLIQESLQYSSAIHKQPLPHTTDRSLSTNYLPMHQPMTSDYQLKNRCVILQYMNASTLHLPRDNGSNYAVGTVLKQCKRPTNDECKYNNTYVTRARPENGIQTFLELKAENWKIQLLSYVQCVRM